MCAWGVCVGCVRAIVALQVDLKHEGESDEVISQYTGDGSPTRRSAASKLRLELSLRPRRRPI